MADIIGTTGNDILSGTSGNDLIVTNGGNDIVNAGDGDDVITVVSQFPPWGTINGGNGIDTLQIERAPAPLIANSPFGVDTVSIAIFYGATFSSIERIGFNSVPGDVSIAVFFYGGNNNAQNQFGSGISTTAELIGGGGRDVLSLAYDSANLPGTVTLPNFTYTNWTTPLQPYMAGDVVAIQVSGAGATTINITPHQGIADVTGGGGNDMAFGSNNMEVFNGAGGGTDLFFGNGGNDALSIQNTYFIQNGVVGPEATNTGAGVTFDGGAGTDWLIFGGHVNFQGTVSNVEGIVLTPQYSNNNAPTATIGAASQYSTGVTLNASVFAGLAANLQLVGEGDITVVATGNGSSFNGSAFVFEAGSAVNFFIEGDAFVQTLTGSSHGDTINGAGGADVINAGGGDDTVWLVSGTETIDGGAGIDRLNVGGTGGPVSLGGAVSGFEKLVMLDTRLTLNSAQFASAFSATTEIGGIGSIVIDMLPGVYLFASQMTNVAAPFDILFTINGSSDTDVIKSILGANNDIAGGDGADQIRGGNLFDRIDGGSGNDKIMGLGGADLLTGGAGADQFRYLFASDAGTDNFGDAIADFAAGEDKLDFRALDADPVAAGRQLLSFAGTAAFHATGAGEVRYEVAGGDLLVQVDLDGNGTADMEMMLLGAGAQTLTGTDFLF